MTLLSDALIEREELPGIVKMSMRTIEEEMRQGRFPKPRRLSGRRCAWRASDINAWMEALPVSDLPPPPNTGAKKPRPLRVPPGGYQAA